MDRTGNLNTSVSIFKDDGNRTASDKSISLLLGKINYWKNYQVSVVIFEIILLTVPIASKAKWVCECEHRIAWCESGEYEYRNAWYVWRL